MAKYGLITRQGEGMSRVHISCMHQSGLLYVVPAEKSWVCSEEHMPAHSLAGFLGELMDLGDSRVKEMMQRWGIYFRQVSLEEGAEEPG